MLNSYEFLALKAFWIYYLSIKLCNVIGWLTLKIINIHNSYDHIGKIIHLKTLKYSLLRIIVLRSPSQRFLTLINSGCSCGDLSLFFQSLAGGPKGAEDRISVWTFGNSEHCSGYRRRFRGAARSALHHVAMLNCCIFSGAFHCTFWRFLFEIFHWCRFHHFWFRESNSKPWDPCSKYRSRLA
jgi:hypothetical protein